MKNLLVFLLIMVTIGNRVGVQWPQCANIIESFTWVLVIYILFKYTKNDNWVIGLMFVLPNFFGDILLLEESQRDNQSLRSLTYTFITVVSMYIRPFRRWSY